MSCLSRVNRTDIAYTCMYMYVAYSMLVSVYRDCQLVLHSIIHARDAHQNVQLGLPGMTSLRSLFYRGCSSCPGCLSYAQQRLAIIEYARVESMRRTGALYDGRS